MTNACVVVDLPYFYIIGGRTITGLTYDFWQYNFTDNQFYLRRSTDLDQDIPLYKHTCSLSIENDKKYVYVFFGSQFINDNPYCGITRFDITDLTNVTTEIISTNVTSFACRTESALGFFGGRLYGFGGQSFNKYIFNDIFIISLNPYQEILTHDSIDSTLYSSACAQFGNTFTFYSGLMYPYYPKIKPSSSIFSYFLENLNGNCGNGFLYDSGCQRCPLGTYSGINDAKCIPCEKGFFSNFSAASDITQCFPCPEGTFSNTKGSSSCLNCESYQYCPIGSTKNLTFTKFNEDSYPKLYQPESNDEFKTICLYCFVLVIVLFLAP